MIKQLKQVFMKNLVKNRNPQNAHVSFQIESDLMSILLDLYDRSPAMFWIATEVRSMIKI